MTDVTPDVYTSHARSLVMLLAQTLSSLQSLGNLAALHILNILRHLIPVAKHDETVSIVRGVFTKFRLLYSIYVSTLVYYTFPLSYLCSQLFVSETSYNRNLMCFSLIFFFKHLNINSIFLNSWFNLLQIEINLSDNFVQI